MTKIRITFKTPDAVEYAVKDYMECEDPETKCDTNLLEELSDKLSKWVKYGECITVEFDLDKMDATVEEC